MSGPRRDGLQGHPGAGEFGLELLPETFRLLDLRLPCAPLDVATDVGQGQRPHVRAGALERVGGLPDRRGVADLEGTQELRAPSRGSW